MLPVGVDQGQVNAVRDPYDNEAPLTVVTLLSSFSNHGPSKTNVANAKSNPRSRRFASLFARSQVKRI